MLDFIRWVIRNPSAITKHARRTWATRKAMTAYRKDNPYCAYCGRDKQLDVHHVQPVSVRPDLAASPSNMIMLCRNKCHLVIGHEGNYAQRYVENVRELCKAQRVVRVTSK